MMKKTVRHIFIVGAKGFTYGGYETFLDKLTEYHQDKEHIQYHIACKKNGQGITDFKKLKGVTKLSADEYRYHNAHCFCLWSPALGSAQAVFYDIAALRYCIGYVKKHGIKDFVVYVLSSRIGPLMGHYAGIIHRLGGRYYNNPDGRESLRRKYSPLVRRYWKLSEKGMVRHSDLVICDSKNIERYISQEYRSFSPKTAYIAYGSDPEPSGLKDDDKRYLEWLRANSLTDGSFYISVGRFVPENNFDIMIREFMRSDSEKDFAIITNTNKKMLDELEAKLHFKKDNRIRFAGTVYDRELLKKIRERAYGYFHGHEVGGTNPSLLEALGSTDLNLLYDVGFNREVAEDGALYWNKKSGNLAALIRKADDMGEEAKKNLGKKARQRITDHYSWQFIADEYEKIWETGSRKTEG